MFSSPFPNAFGLDLSDRSIKMVQLRFVPTWSSKPRYRLICHRRVVIPPGLITNGEIQQPEQIRPVIQKLLAADAHGERWTRSPWVVTSLPDTQGFIKVVFIDKTEEEIGPDDILSAAKRHIPFDEDSYYIDWQIMPGNHGSNKQTKLLMAAVPKNIADMYTYLLESVGLGVVSLELQALATTRAMITASKEYSHEARAVLDIGAARSTLIIYDHDHAQFSRSLPFCGELVTNAISQKLHLDHDEAEKQKITHGLTGPKGSLAAPLQPLVAALADHLETAIQFYYSHFPDANRVTHITMCGGASLLTGLDTVLSAKLKTEAKPGSVWKNLSNGEVLRMPDYESLGLATAIGLALRAAQNPFFSGHLL